MATWHGAEEQEQQVVVNLSPLFGDVPNMRSDLEINEEEAEVTITVPKTREYQPVEVDNWQLPGYLMVKGKNGKVMNRRVIIAGSHPFLYWPEKRKNQKNAKRWKHRMRNTASPWHPGKVRSLRRRWQLFHPTTLHFFLRPRASSDAEDNNSPQRRCLPPTRPQTNFVNL